MNHLIQQVVNDYAPTYSAYRGCLLGGAVGDALGAPVEFMTREEIINKYGVYGIEEFAPCYGGLGKVTDDTQMTLFTAEAMIMTWFKQSTFGYVHSTNEVKNAYLRWLATQTELPLNKEGYLDRNKEGFLIKNQDLYSRRAPGNTCLMGLQQIAPEGSYIANNNSKGCGTIMRVAPIAIMGHACLPHGVDSTKSGSLKWVYDEAIVSAALSHGHPTGQIAAAAFACILFAILCGKTVLEATQITLDFIKQKEFHEETSQALKSAIHQSQNNLPAHIAIANLGEGWVAEEALAIAVYCALKAKNLELGVLMAVNITGDSDSTGSMAGQLLGALYGYEAIPDYFLDGLELKPLLEQLSQDLLLIYYYYFGSYCHNKFSLILWELKKRYKLSQVKQ